MNKVNISNTNERSQDESDALTILQDAENIILASNEEKRKKIKKTYLCCIITILVLIILLLLFSTIFALININNTKIIRGVSIQGVDISNLTKDEANQKISSMVNEHLSKQILVKHLDFEGVFLPEQFEVNLDITSAIDEAYSLGRSGNIFENNYTILNTMLKTKNFSINMSYDETLLISIINELNTLLPDRIVNPDYYINDDNFLIITSGKDGTIIDEISFKTEIESLINDIANNEPTMEIPVTNVKADNIDIDTIYKKIYKDPVDAYYTTDPYVVYPSANGLDFAISIDEAKNLIVNYEEEYSIPLKTLYPNVTTNQIGNEAFPDQLSKFSTSFSSSGSSRSTNISLAAQKLDGVVIMPGETFSYNQTVGQRTKAAGFKEATAYSNGQVVQEVGGGICQVSSTLYNAVLYANLEIVERSNHGFKPSYVKPGLDATVSWGGPDFKFKNNRNYPVRIKTDTSGKVLRIYIYGLKTDNDYTVTLDAQYVSNVPYKTVYQKDSSLSSGESRVIQSGSNGCKTATYKYLYDTNGTLVSSECISRDTYNPHNKIVAVGY